MPVLNTDMGETEDSGAPDTSTLTPGSGKSVKQGLRGLQQKKFKIGVKKQGTPKLGKNPTQGKRAVKLGSK